MQKNGKVLPIKRIYLKLNTAISNFQFRALIVKRYKNYKRITTDIEDMSPISLQGMNLLRYFDFKSLNSVKMNIVTPKEVKLTNSLKNSKTIRLLHVLASDSSSSIETIGKNMSKLKNIRFISIRNISSSKSIHHISKFSKRLGKLQRLENSFEAESLAKFAIIRYTELLIRAKLKHLYICFIHFLSLFQNVAILKPLIQSLKKLESLESLHINPSLVPVFGELYTEIAQVYAILPRLNSLSITVDQDPFCDSYFKGITSSIKNLKNLDRLVYLDIIVSWNFKICMTLEKLFKTVASLKKLSLFYLIEGKGEKMETEDWDLLALGFNHLRKLETLSLDLSQSKQILDEYLENICNQFIENTTISSLSLLFYDHKRYANYHPNIIKFILNFKNLRFLEIGSHGRYAFENNLIKELAEGLKTTKDIETIKLDFKFSKCNNKSIKILCEGLSHLSKLKKLRLNLTGTSVTNGCIKILNKLVFSKPNLVEFGIMMKHIMIDDKLFDNFCINVCRSIKSPVKIKFKYSDYMEETSDEIISLHQKNPLTLRYIIEDMLDDF
jgi:hypothetical protein